MTETKDNKNIMTLCIEYDDGKINVTSDNIDTFEMIALIELTKQSIIAEAMYGVEDKHVTH